MVLMQSNGPLLQQSGTLLVTSDEKVVKISGVLRAIDNGDEFTALLAHEVAHVHRKHAAEH